MPRMPLDRAIEQWKLTVQWYGTEVRSRSLSECRIWNSYASWRNSCLCSVYKRYNYCEIVYFLGIRKTTPQSYSALFQLLESAGENNKVTLIANCSLCSIEERDFLKSTLPKQYEARGTAKLASTEIYFDTNGLIKSRNTVPSDFEKDNLLAIGPLCNHIYDQTQQARTCRHVEPDRGTIQGLVVDGFITNRTISLIPRCLLWIQPMNVPCENMPCVCSFPIEKPTLQ